MLAGSLSALAQTAPAETTLKTVTVREQADAPEGRDSVRATETNIGKGRHRLLDIPRSITVVTDKVMDDRNLDTMKEVLKTTGGISFLAAEGGEEDIRRRGFSLQQTGDIFVDGIRDPAFYERDTFNLDRAEVLRGSASLLFGRGSTGGAVNMVNKQPRLIDEHEVDLTLGSYAYRRAVGDFLHQDRRERRPAAGRHGRPSQQQRSWQQHRQKGLAAAYRWGIGERNGFQASLYHLDHNNGVTYVLPWIRPTPRQSASNPGGSPPDTTILLPLNPRAYFGMASDHHAGSATALTLGHTHRFDRDNGITTQLRLGRYGRDQRTSTIRLAGAASQPGGVEASLATFGPGTVFNRGTPLKIQNLDTFYAQSDDSGKFDALGMRHEVQTGVDLAIERRQVFGARSAAQRGVNLTKPPTTAGTPNAGAFIDEGSRVLRPTNQHSSKGLGIHAQNLVQAAPQWKLLAGLRYDRLRGEYDSFSIPNNAPGPTTTAGYSMKVSEWSQRLGVLYQPNALHSYHFSAATSFNTSGDAYSLSPQNVNIEPEKSINIELGAKLDSTNRQWTTRLAVFRSTKLRERNTDPLVNLVTLSGKRHVASFEAELAGRLTPQWDMFANYVWMPIANIDQGTPGAQGQGTRPSLTPVHSRSLRFRLEHLPGHVPGAVGRWSELSGSPDPVSQSRLGSAALGPGRSDGRIQVRLRSAHPQSESHQRHQQAVCRSALPRPPCAVRRSHAAGYGPPQILTLPARGWPAAWQQPCPCGLPAHEPIDQPPCSSPCPTSSAPLRSPSPSSSCATRSGPRAARALDRRRAA